MITDTNQPAYFVWYQYQTGEAFNEYCFSSEELKNMRKGWGNVPIFEVYQ